MKKFLLLLILIISSLSIFQTSALAAPYRPPSGGGSGDGGNHAPGGGSGGGGNGGSGVPKPTPTPCLPNFCFFGETACCFRPMCVLLGSTAGDPPNYDRCPDKDTWTRIGSSFPGNTVAAAHNVFQFFGRLLGR